MISFSCFTTFHLKIERVEEPKKKFDYSSELVGKGKKEKKAKSFAHQQKSHIKKVAIKSIFYVSPSTNDSFCRLKHE